MPNVTILGYVRLRMTQDALHDLLIRAQFRTNSMQSHAGTHAIAIYSDCLHNWTDDSLGKLVEVHRHSSAMCNITPVLGLPIEVRYALKMSAKTAESQEEAQHWHAFSVD